MRESQREEKRGYDFNELPPLMSDWLMVRQTVCISFETDLTKLSSQNETEKVEQLKTSKSVHGGLEELCKSCELVVNNVVCSYKQIE